MTTKKFRTNRRTRRRYPYRTIGGAGGAVTGMMADAKRLDDYLGTPCRGKQCGRCFHCARHCNCPKKAKR
jgi:hypothetical protein